MKNSDVLLLFNGEAGVSSVAAFYVELGLGFPFWFGGWVGWLVVGINDA